MTHDREFDVRPSAAARARAQELAARARREPDQARLTPAAATGSSRFLSVLNDTTRRSVPETLRAPGGAPRARTSVGVELRRPVGFAGSSDEKIAGYPSAGPMTPGLSQRGAVREAADGARLASAATASEALRTRETEERPVDTMEVLSDADRFEVSGSEVSAAELEVGELEIDRPQAMILVPTAAQHAPQHGQTAGDSPGRRPPAPVLQEIVEFAELHREKDGRCEFHLGLDRKKFKGAEIRVSSHGKRRIGLRIEKSEVIGQSNVDALVEALTERNIEIVEVVMN